MKKFIFLIIAVFLLVSGPGLSNAATVYINNDDPNDIDYLIKPGDNFSIEIFISDLSALVPNKYDNFSFHLNIDALGESPEEGLKFSDPVSVSWGEAVPLDTQAMEWRASDYSVGFYYSPFLPGELPPIEDGKILSLDFGIASLLGEYAITLDGNFYMGSEDIGQPTIINAKASVVPIPGTVLLLGSGLLGLMGIGSRRMRKS